MCLDTQWKTVYHSPVRVVYTTKMCTVKTCSKSMNIYYSQVTLFFQCFIFLFKLIYKNIYLTIIKLDILEKVKIIFFTFFFSLVISFLISFLTYFRSDIIGQKGAVLVYRYTGEFLSFSYPYMELWRSSLTFRSFVYRYTRTQPAKGFNAALTFISERWRFSPQIIEYNEREG